MKRKKYFPSREMKSAYAKALSAKRLINDELEKLQELPLHVIELLAREGAVDGSTNIPVFIDGTLDPRLAELALDALGIQEGGDMALLTTFAAELRNLAHKGTFITPAGRLIEVNGDPVVQVTDEKDPRGMMPGDFVIPMKFKYL